jgi:hypothetical protein
MVRFFTERVFKHLGILGYQGGDVMEIMEIRGRLLIDADGDALRLIKACQDAH